jgi:hypothetical protein
MGAEKSNFVHKFVFKVMPELSLPFRPSPLVADLPTAAD